MPPTPPRKLHPDLPVFLLEDDGRAVVYTPGHAAVIAPADAEPLRLALAGTAPDGRAARLAAAVEAAARKASAGWDALGTAEFAPECLTVYLSNVCNLGCGYCYAAEPDGSRVRPLPLLDARELLAERDVTAAADLVAACCAAKGKPFHFVAHGGGEPTRHPELLARIVELTRAAAARHGVGWWGYVATHGVYPGDTADWLARTFDKVGVSCDGPPAVHDRQRPTAGGGPTYAAVAATIRRLTAAGADVALRATVTPEGIARQAEVVAHFHREFAVTDVRFEPAYAATHPARRAFRPEDAPAFARHFLAAQRLAAALGVRLELSGVRLDELHGPYCNVLRDVLHLTPDGTATACFLSTSGGSELGSRMVVGRVDPASGRFELDRDHVRDVRRRALRIPARCHGCVNVYHCARDCPDVCPVLEPDDAPAGFRCGVQKILGETWVRELADRPPAPAPPPTADDAGAVARFLTELPAGVDPAAVVREWRAATAGFDLDRRAMPEPPWAARGFDHAGPAAWDAVAEAVARRDPGAPLAAYVHLPFCDRTCAFCDCYAVRMSPDRRDREAAYVDALLREVAAWGRLGGLRGSPVTTVHFGGGTPSYTAPDRFETLLGALRGLLAADGAEWALESTSSQLSRDHLERLHAWGFRRLHVGVQTFDDPLRRAIGRREAAAVVLDKIGLALGLGFVVSVDLIYGLPGQSLGGFVRDVETAVAAGADGCSLYHLNASRRNRAFVTADRPALSDYLFFQVGEQLLRGHGYRKNHFAHFARPRDRNLYYTHVVRGEDLIALGTSADGSVGDYLYRHPGLGPYVGGTTAARPALEGGLRESAAAVAVRPASAALMSGTIDTAQLTALGAAHLVPRWLEHRLIAPDGEPGRYTLTASGSWFLSELLRELTGTAGPESEARGGRRPLHVAGI